MSWGRRLWRETVFINRPLTILFPKANSCIPFASFFKLPYLSLTFCAVICLLLEKTSSFTLLIQSAGLSRKRSWCSSIQVMEVLEFFDLPRLHVDGAGQGGRAVGAPFDG